MEYPVKTTTYKSISTAENQDEGCQLSPEFPELPRLSQRATARCGENWRTHHTSSRNISPPQTTNGTRPRSQENDEQCYRGSNLTGNKGEASCCTYPNDPTDAATQFSVYAPGATHFPQ
ncbi:hypothetical protein TNCV_4879631 [Trichonephila clavipes]|nr:hypothetical protein TNCV_4879631 [Trichonephila clavipes]